MNAKIVIFAELHDRLGLLAALKRRRHTQIEQPKRRGPQVLPDKSLESNALPEDRVANSQRHRLAAHFSRATSRPSQLGANRHHY